MNNDKIILPKKDKEGNYYISYSQIKLWKDVKGYNTGLEGKKEYIRSYFLGEEYPDRGGFAQFGSEVEAYITERQCGDCFTEPEKILLEQIEPLGLYQKEIKIPFDGFYLLGFIDDTKPDLTHIRDYKSASEKSKAKYYEDDYKQLDIYALAILKETGKIPKQLEVCVIERLGNGFKGGRKELRVGERLWYIDRETNKKKLKELEKSIEATVKEISDYYKIFLILNK